MDKAYTMVGYGPKGHVIEPVESTNWAKELGKANGIDRFFLIPERQRNDHLGYILRENDEYEKVWLAEMLQTLCPNTLRVVGR
jgi:hypothetical protein